MAVLEIILFQGLKLFSYTLYHGCCIMTKIIYEITLLNEKTYSKIFRMIHLSTLYALYVHKTGIDLNKNLSIKNIDKIEIIF